MAGYRGTFYCFGAFNILIAVVISLNFPKDALKNETQTTIDQENEIKPDIEQELSDVDIEAAIDKPVTFMGVFRSARFVMAALISTLSYIMCSFMEPILSTELERYNLT